MLKNLKKRSEGFTIIEVLIVLAIAGLILLIVFLAVPALQRNSRNTQRANDASRALGASQEVLNNNNGDMLLLTDTNLRTAIGKPAYYTSTSITVDGSALTAATNGTSIDSLTIHKGAKCSTVAAEIGKAIDGTDRQLAAVWTAEDGTATGVKRCQDS